MSLFNQALPYVGAISPYQPGKPITELAREMAIPVEKIVKLASNENPLGMSPRAKEAVNRVMEGVARYPDQFDLIRAVAERTGVPMEQVVLGNGSNDILEMVARVFLASGRSAVFSQHAFAIYALATAAAGATCISVPAREFGHDLEAILLAIREDTRIVWIANPNNPTGTFVPHQELHAFLAQVPRHVVVVLDEAYNEYLPLEDRYDAVEWLKEFPNLLVTRTFSKIYGLAGLRIGYGVASAEVADLLNRVRQPFNCNNLALAAAEAALDDVAFLNESFRVNREGMEQIVAGLKGMGQEYIPSYGNFIAVKVGDGARVNQKLLQQGVIVRPVTGYGMPEWLRVTIGTGSENTRFLEALRQAL